MSSTTPNIGLTKTTAAETIGQNWAASNDSGGNFDIIDTKMGAVGNTSLQAQVDALSSQIATELASKQYVFSTSSASTLAEQVLAFCENHRGQSNYTASFFMSAGNAPSDLPANTNTWKYAFGEARIRISPLSGGVDGVIILYAFSANQMAIRYIANSVVSSEWKVFS